MAAPETLPFTLVTILLLVAPGYVAVRIFLRRAERSDTLDRTEKIVWSSAASLASIFTLYILSPKYFGAIATWGEKLVTQFGIVSGSTLLEIGLSTSVLLYVLHLTILFLGAVVVAEVDRRQRDDTYGQRRPWYYAFTDLGEEKVRVILQDGPHIEGQFVPPSWDPSSKELFLESPTRRGTSEPIGRSILISSDEISAVVFTQEDPDSEGMEEIDTSTEAAEQIEEFREGTDDDTLSEPSQENNADTAE